jgi:hypothetical protein
MTAPLALHVDRSGREWQVPEGYVPGQPGFCRGCSVLVLWARTPRGKSTPLDQDGRPHWATCPKAAEFRRKG